MIVKSLVAAFGALFIGSALSPAGAAVVSGNIAVYDQGTNTFLGYVGSSETIFATLPIATTLAGALQVSLDPTASAPFSISATGLQEADIGPAAGVSGVAFGPGSPSYAFFGSVSPGNNSTNPIGTAAESAVWSLVNGNQLTAAWTLPGNSTAPLTIFQDITFGDLDFAGDLSAFVATYGDSVEPVYFLFTGLPSDTTSAPEPATLSLLGVSLVGTSIVRRKRRQRG
jgi:hypothetical protein